MNATEWLVWVLLVFVGAEAVVLVRDWCLVRRWRRANEEWRMKNEGGVADVGSGKPATCNLQPATTEAEKLAAAAAEMERRNVEEEMTRMKNGECRMKNAGGVADGGSGKPATNAPHADPEPGDLGEWYRRQGVKSEG